MRAEPGVCSKRHTLCTTNLGLETSNRVQHRNASRMMRARARGCAFNAGDGHVSTVRCAGVWARREGRGHISGGPTRSRIAHPGHTASNTAFCGHLDTVGASRWRGLASTKSTTGPRGPARRQIASLLAGVKQMRSEFSPGAKSHWPALGKDLAFRRPASLRDSDGSGGLRTSMSR